MLSPLRSLTCITLFLAITLPTHLLAQNEVGVVGGGALNFHDANFGKLGSYPSCCPAFAGGSGTGFYLGGWYGVSLGDRFRFLGRLTYSTESGTMTDEERSFVADLRDTAKVVNALFTHQIDASLASIGIEPLISFRAFGGLDLLLGARLAVTLATSFHQTETLTEPSDYGAYLGDDRVWVDTQANIPDAAAFRATIVGGIRYVLPIGRGRSTFLAPELTYQFPLTGASSGVTWSVAQFRFGIALGWELRSSQTADSSVVKPPPPLIAPPPPVVVIGPPIVSVHASGMLADGTIIPNPTIRIEETQVTTLHPLIGHIYFDEGSSTLPQRYVDGAKRALADTIALTPLEAAQGEIAIMAQRLNTDTKSRIKVTGNTSGQGADVGLDLARARAERIRDEFVALGIDSKRIDVSARNVPLKFTRATEADMLPLAAAENRRVEITSSDAAVLSPVSLGSIDVSLDPSDLRIESSVAAPGGLRQSKLVVRQGARTLHEADQLETSSRTTTIKLLNKDPRSFTADPLVAELTATDSLGKTSVALDTVELVQLTVTKKRIEQLGDTQIERFGLVLFEFNDVAVTGDNARLIEYVRSRMKPETLVRIIGATDVMGTAEYNRELSVRRAREVAKMLNVSEAQIEGVGEDRPLFPNELPEGRAYNRTVVIELVTPVR